MEQHHLYMACHHQGHLKVVQSLLTHFKEILILTKIAEERPLACAMKKGHTHIAALLRHHKVMYDKW
jgi:nicotinamide mononucleotide adenylyltransferase